MNRCGGPKDKGDENKPQQSLLKKSRKEIFEEFLNNSHPWFKKIAYPDFLIGKQ